MNESKFHICIHCGNLIGFVKSSGVPMICCGEEMKLLIPNTTDAAHEKHVPQVTSENNIITVTVGSAAHPMTSEHLIEWIYLKTQSGGQRKNLVSGDSPALQFTLVNDTPIAVYAYCNLHGLWASDL